MLILLHDGSGNELIVNTAIIAMVREQWSSHLMSVRYILSTTTGGEITIKESPREVKFLQDQAAKKARGGR
nr:MAG TPA: Flagellar and Swarming motility protein [Herelleviridae sp.]